VADIFRMPSEIIRITASANGEKCMPRNIAEANVRIRGAVPRASG
jgi:hypothetical protein